VAKAGRETVAGSPSQGRNESITDTHSMYSRISVGPPLAPRSDTAHVATQPGSHVDTHTREPLTHTHTHTSHKHHTPQSTVHPSQQALIGAQVEPAPPHLAASGAAVAAPPSVHTLSEVSGPLGASAPPDALASSTVTDISAVTPGLSLQSGPLGRSTRPPAPLATGQARKSTQAAAQAETAAVGGIEKGESGDLSHGERARRVTQVMAMIEATPMERTFSTRDVRGLVAAAAMQLGELGTPWDATATLQLRSSTLTGPAGVVVARAIIMGHRPVRVLTGSAGGRHTFALGARYARRRQAKQQQRSSAPRLPALPEEQAADVAWPAAVAGGGTEGAATEPPGDEQARIDGSGLDLQLCTGITCRTFQ
jgi:hypothetical protein